MFFLMGNVQNVGKGKTKITQSLENVLWELGREES